MQLMNLKEWSTLDDEGKKNWLALQNHNSLMALLGMINEMLMNADELDAMLAMIEEPTEDVLNARNFTYNTLRDVETHIVRAIQLKEQTV